jgi:nitroreductase
MALPKPLSYLITSCEKLCVKECCGIESFDFSPVHIASWLQQSRGEPMEKTVALLNEQLEDLRIRHGSGSSNEGYESDENELNQDFSAQQVDQLVDQVSTNLKHAIELTQQSNLVQWKPEGTPSSISHQPELGNEFVRALSWRYATKKFDSSRHVGAEDIESILIATNLSASSYGLQPYQYLLIQDKALQEKLVPVSYGQPQVLDASAVLVFAIRTNIDDDYIRQSAKETEEARGLESGQLDGYAKQMIGSIMGLDEDQRNLWATKQCYISMGTALAACAMLGVDACPMEGIQPDKYDEILELESKNLHAVLALPIGYRASDDINGSYAKVRKPLGDMVIRIG